MKIKSNNSQFKKSLTFALIGIVLIGLMLLFGYENQDFKSYIAPVQNELNIPRHVLSYEELLESKKYEIYNQRGISAHLYNAGISAKLVFLYKNKPKNRELTDRFFVHVYVNDKSKLIGNKEYANSDFSTLPKPVTINNSTYYVFEKNLKSSQYREKLIPFDDIKYLNLGRYEPGVGRSIDIKNINPKEGEEVVIKNSLDQTKESLDHIKIKVSQEQFAKIEQKRAKAVQKGVLLSEEGDLVKGEIKHNTSDYKKVAFRLKGDWTDHLNHPNKWSYRFIMKGDATIHGMRKFSIQHPKVRNYLWEWLFNKVVKEEGLIGLRYDFVNTTMLIEGDNHRKIQMGIMTLEESFDKILIENNKKREGVILAFDENLLWKDRYKQNELQLLDSAKSSLLHNIDSAPVRTYNATKILADPKLRKQFETAKSLIEGWRNGTYKISEVFDVELLAKFVALSNLFGGSHGLIWHNLRFYYNPITNRLEPISFDSNSGKRLTKTLHYPLSKDDEYFQERLSAELKRVSSIDYIDELLNTYKQELSQLSQTLGEEFGISDRNITTLLTYNSNFIKKNINPAVLITAGLQSHQAEAITVEVHNVSEKNVAIGHLEDLKGLQLDNNAEEQIIAPNTTKKIVFNLSDYFNNAFVSKKNKKGTFSYPKDVKKLRLTHYIPGVDFVRKAEIRPYATTEDPEKQAAQFRKANTANYFDFSFIQIVSDSAIILKKGTHTLTEDLIIPTGIKTTVLPGCKLDFKNGASLKSEGSFIAQGTQEEKIRFLSSDATGGGIFITNAQQKSILDHCVFDNLSNPHNEMWAVSGAVNFHESEVTITNTLFKNNRCEDALNVIRSSFTMTDSVFENTFSDAFDGDFVEGKLERCTFSNAGNDGIDVSGSILELRDIKVINPSDKAISAGENSTITGGNIHITNGEIGVVSKDLSSVTLSDLQIEGTRLGLSAFQKKTEYGVGTIHVTALALQGNELDYLIERNSILTIDAVPVETVSNNVIDQMYGKEYGKSSK